MRNITSLVVYNVIQLQEPGYDEGAVARTVTPAWIDGRSFADRKGAEGKKSLLV